MQFQLDSRYDAVVSFIADASAADIPPAVQAHLYRFGTVLVCGYIERSIEIIIIERLRNRAQPRVLNFIKSYFKRGRNLDGSAIAELLSRFESAWYREFDKFIQANPQVKEVVSSCYGMRNTVAHGGTTNLSLNRLNEFLAAAKQMVDAAVVATR